jgi:hypothetical protein
MLERSDVRLLVSLLLGRSDLQLLRTLRNLWPSPAGPHLAMPQERPPVGVGRLKCPTNKNNNKIYQMGSNKVIMNEDM